MSSVVSLVEINTHINFICFDSVLGVMCGMFRKNYHSMETNLSPVVYYPILWYTSRYQIQVPRRYMNPWTTVCRMNVSRWNICFRSIRRMHAYETLENHKRIRYEQPLRIERPNSVQFYGFASSSFPSTVFIFSFELINLTWDPASACIPTSN